MSKEEESISWLMRLKQILQNEPRNKEELIAFLRDAHTRKLIDAETLGMMESVLQLAQLQVRDVMLPKNQMISVSQNDSLEKIIVTVTTSGHSRFPVTGENSSEVIGILHAKDLLPYHLNHALEFELNNIIRAATFVPESKRLDLLLREFRSNRNHMALVVDEYGSTSGFVTIEDIIEQIIGDIEDEFDIDDETYIKAHGDAHYIVKGHTPISEFNREMNVHFSDDNYDTLSGIIIEKLGYLPQRGEVVTIEPFDFKIIHADARRIKLVSCFDKRQFEDKA